MAQTNQEIFEELAIDMFGRLGQWDSESTHELLGKCAEIMGAKYDREAIGKRIGVIESFNCGACGKEFSSIEDLAKHVGVCDNAKNIMTLAKRLHEIKQEVKNNFSCSTCDFYDEWEPACDIRPDLPIHFRGCSNCVHSKE